MLNISEFIKKRFNPQEKYGLTLTIGAVVTLVFIWFFYVILEDFVSKEFLYLSDLRILNLVKLYRTPRLNQAMLAITYLGKWEVIFLGTLFVSIVLLIQRKWTYLWTFIASVVGGQIIVTVIKNLVDRTRPPVAEALVIENTYSFPSGHSLIAVTFYGFLTYLVFKHLKSRISKFFAVLIGLFIILSIGSSRVYLGVHFPSDVLAGYFIGSAWVAALITSIEVSGIKTDEKKWLFAITGKSLLTISVCLVMLWLAFWGFWTLSHPLPEAPALPIPSG
jgi:undecaprenyl-diphosphatase